MLNVRQRRQADRQVYLQQLVDFKLSEHKIAELLDVDVATVKRWLAGKSRIPRMAIIALEAFDGRLPNMDQWPAWRGCKISQLDGRLYTEHWKRGFLNGEIAAIPYMEGIIEKQDKRLKDLEAQVERLKEANNGAANDPLAWKHGWPEPLPGPLLDMTPKKARKRKA